MKTTLPLPLLAVALAVALAACGGESEEPAATDAPEAAAADPRPVLENYADLVHGSYLESIRTARELERAVEAFLAQPGEERLAAAREAWLAAREPYGQTEAYRFYGGPIDDEETGHEGRINAWPLDEAYIDAIVGGEGAHPGITAPVLIALNEKGGEKNIATGYHAIEYLLWGRDGNADGPGSRPFTDYVGQERRGRYLAVVTRLLIEDLEAVAGEWAPDRPGNYRSRFLAEPPEDALRKMLLGIGSLSGAELSGERMTVAYDTREQEDEHSCFSDNTHRDLYLNALGIQNVYLGRFGEVDGPGLDELVRAVDPELDRRLQVELDRSVAAILAIPAPFDRAIQAETGRAKVQAAIEALRTQTSSIAEVARALGVRLHFEE